jgi:hypothetical protein
MKIQAQNVRPGDRIQGIGMVVEMAVPQDDFNTFVEGHVSDREQGEQFATSVILPNAHWVRVSRPFQVGDAVTVPSAEAGEDNVVTTQFVRATVTEVVNSGVGVVIEGQEDSGTEGFTFSEVRHAHAG